MSGAAGAGVGHLDGVGPRGDVGKQLLHGLIIGVGRDDDDLRVVRRDHDRLVVVVAQLAQAHDALRAEAVGAEEDDGAVVRRVKRHAAADRAGGPRLVFHDEFHAQRLAKRGGKLTADKVGGAAGTVGHDHRDRFKGIALRCRRLLRAALRARGGACGQRKDQRKGGEQGKKTFHESVPLFSFSAAPPLKKQRSRRAMG